MIVGLGNPGREYAETRHNAGFRLLDALAREHALGFTRDARRQAETCRWQSRDIDCRLCKPLVSMNESGVAAQALSAYYKIPPQALLVVHDELDLSPGVARVKQGGGHGGHNGLRDIVRRLGSSSFTRLRIGIGHPGHRDQVTPYVLSKPSSHDRKLIEDAIIRALAILPLLLRGETQKAMNILHGDNAGDNAGNNTPGASLKRV